jgi:hypothetical protein
MWDEQIHAEIARREAEIVEDDREDGRPDETLLRALAEALGHLGQPQAIPRLNAFVPYMYRYDPPIWLDVAIALDRLGDDRWRTQII